MYRTYENPAVIADMIEAAEIEKAEYIEAGDIEAAYDIDIYIHELKDRLNFAWQDDEYDCENAEAEFDSYGESY